ncbi:MAG: hypothetical protein J6T73_01595, partial [Clostridia bacterium]|nr:hypothetical protein [Clostridia bacterium]
MKKSILVTVFVLLVCVLSLSACKSEEKKTSENTNSQAGQTASVSEYEETSSEDDSTASAVSESSNSSKVTNKSKSGNATAD